MVYTLRFICSKCRLFHNSNVFGSCIIHILYAGCAKIKKKYPGAKRLRECAGIRWEQEWPTAHHIRFEVHYNTARTSNSGRAVAEGAQYRTCAHRTAHQVASRGQAIYVEIFDPRIRARTATWKCPDVRTSWNSKQAVPLQAWTGPEGSCRLKLPDFKTIGTWRW